MSKLRAAMVTCLVMLALLFLPAWTNAQQSSLLPSWNDGAAKQAITEFVRATTSFQQFPSRQRLGSFSVEQAMEKFRNPPSSN